MAHRDHEHPVTQVTSPIGTLQSDSPADNVLTDFATHTVALRNILYDDSPLKEAEYVFMEKHMQVLEMAYLRWKRKHIWPTDFH